MKFSVPSEIIKYASNYLTDIQLKLFASQIRLEKVMKKGRRYTKTDASFALVLHHKSPKAYRFMSKIFALPAVRTLRSWLHSFEFKIGWNECIFKQLKEKADIMDKKDRVCVLMFDAVAIKSGLYYNTSKDKMEGIEDLGMYGRSDKVAKYAMVFMVRGLAHKWKQTLGYFLLNSSIKPDTLKNMILNCLTKLQEANLIPKDKMNIRLAPKLTDKHIYCNTFDKMRVCMATQVFSRTVAAGIDTHSSLGSLPKDAATTATFIYKMDMLFD
ncbi:uncharacterized protein LOC135100120 [Scylla paramamosain]|uniref:uncharacterized protein LOC135100120 n=1 Tax=Scylla paramamosain TaxID=85552 RepID=UPI003083A2B9